MYYRLRRDWRNPRSLEQSAVMCDCTCLTWALNGAWEGATHTTTPASNTPASKPPMQDTTKEVSKKARAYAQSPQRMQQGVMQQGELAQHKFNVHFQERGWVLKPKPMQRCRRDAACEQLEETRTLEQPYVQRPPKIHPKILSAINAFTPTELSFRSPLRLRAQVSGERPDRDITSHLSVYRKATLFA